LKATCNSWDIVHLGKLPVVQRTSSCRCCNWKS